VKAAHDVGLTFATGAGTGFTQLGQAHERLAVIVPLDGQLLADNLYVDWLQFAVGSGNKKEELPTDYSSY
jgi:hypothetical protein